MDSEAAGGTVLIGTPESALTFFGWNQTQPLVLQQNQSLTRNELRFTWSVTRSHVLRRLSSTVPEQSRRRFVEPIVSLREEEKGESFLLLLFVRVTIMWRFAHLLGNTHSVSVHFLMWDGAEGNPSGLNVYQTGTFWFSSQPTKWQIQGSDRHLKALKILKFLLGAFKVWKVLYFCIKLDFQTEQFCNKVQCTDSLKA